MQDITIIKSRWKQLLKKVEENNGQVHALELGEKAAVEEVEVKEKEVGYTLPPSYKYILQHLGKSLYFYYTFSDDTIIPPEYDEIFSGGLNWNIDDLQNLNILADSLMQGEQGYETVLKGKLQFSNAGNGDIYAFDMLAEGEEKPVVYWSHEEDTVTYIADSFLDYLIKMTELGCIGSELWQFESFLSESGLDITSPRAINWQLWFKSFSETTIEDVRNNLKQLTAFVVYRKKVDNETVDCYRQFNKKDLFRFLIEELEKQEQYHDQKIICEIIGRVLGNEAEPWVSSLWDGKKDIIHPELRSFLTSMCLKKDAGLALVFDFLVQNNSSKINGSAAFRHLASFHHRDVISWMELNVSFPVTLGWDELFVRSDFSWKDILRWTSLEEKHEVTVIHALEMYISENKAKRFPHSISGLPSKTAVIDFLLELRTNQVLKKRIHAIDQIIENIDVLYGRTGKIDRK